MHDPLDSGVLDSMQKLGFSPEEVKSDQRLLEVYRKLKQNKISFPEPVHPNLIPNILSSLTNNTALST